VILVSDSVDNLDDDLAEIVGYLTVSRDVTGHRLTRVFRDWVEMAVCAFESNDEVYLDVLDRHMPDHCDQDDRREVAEAFSEALGELLTSTLDKQRPVIGDIYEAIGANSDAFGQFFTGWPLCRTKARMTITEDCWPCNTDDGRLVLCPDCRDERSVEPITLTDGGVMSSAREPREAHCQFCGGYAGHGPDPRYCSHCRAAGEHLTTCAMCEEEVPKDEIDEFCSDCRETIDELDRLLEDANDE